MKSRLLVIMTVAVAVVLSSGCGNGPQQTSSPQQYLKWLADPENGLVKTKRINGLEITVKNLPAHYLAWQESLGGHYTRAQKDSMVAACKNSLTFLLSIGPDRQKNAEGSVMAAALSDYKEYAERVMTMNFDMSQYVRLRTGRAEYEPVLSAMENTYELSGKRNLIFVFAPKENAGEFGAADRLEFVYDDELFALGTNRFLFDKEDLERAPVLSF